MGIHITGAGVDTLGLLMSQWGAAYVARLALLGSSATLLPFGDPAFGAADAAIFKTHYSASGLNTTFTWSEPPSGFDTPFGLPKDLLGSAPIITFNGTDEKATAPDDDWWSFTSGSADESFSIIMWIKTPTPSTVQTLISRWANSDANGREYTVTLTASNLKLTLRDSTASVAASRPSLASVLADTWTHIAVVYDITVGSGATAANGISLYVDGNVTNGTASNNASYVCMRNHNMNTALFHDMSAAGPSAANFFVGSVAGGPVCPAIINAAITQNVIYQDYMLGRAILGLDT